MSFESATVQTLEASSAITQLVGPRVYFGTAPHDCEQPFVVCRRVSTSPTLSTDNGAPGSSELDNIRLEVGCYSRDLSQANALMRAARRALEAARPTVYLLQDTTHDYSDLPDLYQAIGEFSCWHQDTVSP